MVPDGTRCKYMFCDTEPHMLISEQNDFPTPGLPASYTRPHKSRKARDPAAKQNILQGAVEGHVLVKNTNNSLPLKQPDIISVFGYDAATPPESNLPEPLGGYRLGFLSLYGINWLQTIRYPFKQPGKSS